MIKRKRDHQYNESHPFKTLQSSLNLIFFFYSLFFASEKSCGFLLKNKNGLQYDVSHVVIPITRICYLQDKILCKYALTHIIRGQAPQCRYFYATKIFFVTKCALKRNVLLWHFNFYLGNQICLFFFLCIGSKYFLINVLVSVCYG